MPYWVQKIIDTNNCVIKTSLSKFRNTLFMLPLNYRPIIALISHFTVTQGIYCDLHNMHDVCIVDNLIIGYIWFLINS